jgi:ATP-binding cassette, subfamily B, bacterial IrtA/YbtP
MLAIGVLLKLQDYMTGRRALLPVALAFSAISALAGMAPFVFIWFIVRELFLAETGFSSGIIGVYAWWAVGTAVAGILSYFAALSLSHLAAFRVEANMRKLAMQKIIGMPLGFFDANTTGRIRKIIDDNASITHAFLAHQMPDLAATILMPLTVMVLIFTFDWRLGIACMIPIVFSVSIMSFMMGKKGRYFMGQYMSSLENMNTEAVEYVRGIPVVKVFQQTVYSFKNFHDSIIKYKDMVFEYTRMWEKPMSAYTVIINGFVFFLVPTAVLLVNSGANFALTILNLFLYVLITPVFSQGIMRSMYLNQSFGQASEAVKRIEALSNYPKLSVAPKTRAINGNDIQFVDVSFSYPGSGKKAIDGVSFAVPAGKTVALVGASGSGKTTIAKLVSRFWDVDEGGVYIGGVNVKEISPKELMGNVSFVFQNPRLFKSSLLDNIRYGKPSATIDEVERAVDLVQCRGIVDKLSDGLRTKIGTEGTYLSGGEQQRIVLARAILKNAPIIVLDEAIAFADPENEHLIQQALKKLMENKTVLMIAHRLTSVVEADNILVISEGRVSEQGTHSDLLRRKKVYTRMWKEYSRSIKWTIEKDVHYA